MPTAWWRRMSYLNLIDVTLKCVDANWKLVEVDIVADVDAEDHVGNSLLIWELKFGHKAKLLFRLWAQGLVKILKLKFRQDFEAGVWILVESLGFEILNFKFSGEWDADVWLRS